MYARAVGERGCLCDSMIGGLAGQGSGLSRLLSPVSYCTVRSPCFASSNPLTVRVPTLAAVNIEQTANATASSNNRWAESSCKSAPQGTRARGAARCRWLRSACGECLLQGLRDRRWSVEVCTACRAGAAAPTTQTTAAPTVRAPPVQSEASHALHVLVMRMPA